MCGDHCHIPSFDVPVAVRSNWTELCQALFISHETCNLFVNSLPSVMSQWQRERIITRPIKESLGLQIYCQLLTLKESFYYYSNQTLN